MHNIDQETENKYLDIIRQVAGADARITRAKSGLVNAVFLVDERYVFRFPRDDQIYAQQIFERDICSYLAKYSGPLPFAILHPVDITLEHCFVYEYIPGDTMDEQGLRTLSPMQQKEFVQNVLNFIAWLGNSLYPDTYQSIAENSLGRPIEHWDVYINRTVKKFNVPGHAALTEICQELLGEMSQFYPDGIMRANNRVIHDDLHMGNLLFVDNKLSGVIDFGNIMIGDLACELRHFYRLSPEIAQLACSTYEANYKQKVSIDKVAWWAKINDAATLCEKILTDKIGSPSYERAKANLHKWYPEKKWDT
jgi:aminoglycoside phosphotransferase (APT) family kinase protein